MPRRNGVGDADQEADHQQSAGGHDRQTAYSDFWGHISADSFAFIRQLTEAL